MPAGKVGSGIVPWHMWGDTKNVAVVSSGGLVTFGEEQFARINYARPETWSFILAATIVDQSGQIVDGTVLTVHYDLTVGVGRSSVTIPDFHVFTFNYAGVRPIGQTLWTNTAGNRVAADGVPAADPNVNYATTSWVDTFVASDIQLKVRVGLDSAGERTTATVACSAFFAPKTHIRPEWFIHRFPGGEHSGV